jgi:hypothetical protein
MFQVNAKNCVSIRFMQVNGYEGTAPTLSPPFPPLRCTKNQEFYWKVILRTAQVGSKLAQEQK